MKIEDYAEIHAIWENTPGVGISSADSRKNIEKYLSQNPNQSFVCKADGRIVGTILCGNDGRRAYIHHTAVVPEHRRQGIASELVKMALIEQKAHGIEKCHLFIINENELGKAFWEQIGFISRTDIGIMSKDIN
jgi:putative acetyltransferase